jgi:AcrR family transcriptional regulator
MSNMSTPPDRRSRKRLATREGISNAATRLFLERGFENVTVDEIAEAADVGRMTVFNHFPRKEDMFFDRDEAGREMLTEALRQRDPRVAPIETLRLLAHRLVAEQSPYVRFSAGSQGFIETIEGSETLKARARAIRDEIAQVVTVALSECVGREPTDPAAHLAAGLLPHPGSPDLSGEARYRRSESRLSRYCREGDHRPKSRNGRHALRLSNQLRPDDVQQCDRLAVYRH